MDQFTSDRISRSFEAQTMMQTLGARLAELGPGEVRIEAPILPGLRQQQGFGHAGLTFSLGDTAAGYAALSLMPPDRDVLTAEIKINLLAPAVGDLLIATGRVIKPGRRLMVVSAEVHARQADKLTLIAILQGTMVPVDGFA
ncbi:PaaI family thioesterase [Seohaeicola sp. SP36]|uniref:PaaI family thioesterase n=1 Tax=unclassified Seohaeicola TaxID=2641111 RepID=UPI00237A5A6B|nr:MULTISPECIES: PaaI family thioesterase [unclassified Seohaeicola]MDD9706836.1 PaaI family thioesterase [Seohaeicola sp. 4SK31]MDD9735072.1 PaaI family thioesterase [Seohaeicola sp. SP36]